MLATGLQATHIHDHILANGGAIRQITTNRAASQEEHECRILSWWLYAAVYAPFGTFKLAPGGPAQEASSDLQSWRLPSTCAHHSETLMPALVEALLGAAAVGQREGRAGQKKGCLWSSKALMCLQRTAQNTRQAEAGIDQIKAFVA